MQTYRLRLFRFTRTAYVHDLTTDGPAQRLAEIRRKALRFQTLRHTAGTPSTFALAA